MARKLMVSVLAAGAFASVVGFSSGTAAADCGDGYNNNRDYCTSAPVVNYQDNNRGWDNGRDWNNNQTWIDGPPGYAPVLVDNWQRNFSWTFVQDEAGGFGYYNLCDRGDRRGPRGRVDYVRIRNYDYNLPVDAFMINGTFTGIVLYR